MTVWSYGLMGLALALAADVARAEVPATAPTRAQYDAVKTVMTQFYAKGDPHFRSTLAAKGDYDLYHCEVGSEYLGTSADGEPAMTSFADIAFDQVVWTNNLKKLNYPATLWQPPLADYESQEIARVIATPKAAAEGWSERREKVLKALHEKLDAYRKTKPALRKVVVEGGCGAGEMSVTIATEPKGGQVLFIPTFFYELCRVQNVNPDDTAGCNRWREAVDGQLSSVSGDYLYIVRWPDGTTRRGKLSFDKLGDGQTVTLRKP